MTQVQKTLQVVKQEAQAHFRNGRFMQAKALYTQICAIAPNDVDAWCVLADICGRLNAYAEAISCCQRALQLQPDAVHAHYNLAQANHRLGNFATALNGYGEVIKRQPGHAEAHYSFAWISYKFGDHRAARLGCERTLALAPQHWEAHALLGSLLLTQGFHVEAERSLRTALRLHPQGAGEHSQLLSILNYCCTDPKQLLREHVAWGRMHAPLKASVFPAHVSDPHRRLRVGYVSPDFRTHSVSYFFIALLKHHDPAQIETYCYSTTRRPDGRSAELQALAGHWRSVAECSDQQLAERINADGIDILVDLAGHTAGNRLAVFAWRPAPVQVTYLGYPNTTGVAGIDYRLTDARADPASPDKHTSETLVYLPQGFLCDTPPAEAPPVSPLPGAGQALTFGSFNNTAKLTPACVSLWASVLHALPHSKLMLKYRYLQDPVTCDRIYTLFAERGIAKERLMLHGHTDSMEAHLATYASIDIALDTIPYNGTTTTCEALWMGVPVMCLAGHTHTGRVGASLLHQVGLAAECVSDNADDYIAKTRYLADNLTVLAHLRATLRSRMAASALCDGYRFTRHVEEAYRSMWKTWCETATTGTSDQRNSD